MSELLEIQDDPVTVHETVRKLEKVVKAVPRMESFINSVTQITEVPLERVLPCLQKWKEQLLN